MSHHPGDFISGYETPWTGTENSFSLLRMSYRHASENAAFVLALIGVAAHSVADIHCR